MQRRTALLVLLAALIAVGGCAPVRSGSYTLASTDLGAEDLGGEFVLVQKAATAQGATPVFFVPFSYPRDYEIMAQMLEEHGGDLLTNVTFTSSVSLFLGLIGQIELDIQADVWRKADGMSHVAPGELKTLDEIQGITFSRLPGVEANTPPVRVTEGGQR